MPRHGVSVAIEQQSTLSVTHITPFRPDDFIRLYAGLRSELRKANLGLTWGEASVFSSQIQIEISGDT